MQKVINFYGGPGSGKSTVAAGLFYKMKASGYSVELVNEFAKECVWENNIPMLQDQLWILSHQHRKLLRLRDKVDYIITDSPVLLSPIYRTMYGEPIYTDIIDKLARECYNMYDNINFILERLPTFIPEGRAQSYKESLYVDREIMRIFEKEINDDYIQVNTELAVNIAFEYIEGE